MHKCNILLILFIVFCEIISLKPPLFKAKDIVF